MSTLPVKRTTLLNECIKYFNQEFSVTTTQGLTLSLNASSHINVYKGRDLLLIGASRAEARQKHGIQHKEVIHSVGPSHDRRDPRPKEL